MPTVCTMSLPSSSLSDAIRTQANQWWVQLHSGSARQSDAQDFQQWLEQSPEHRAAWREVMVTMNTVTPGLQAARHLLPEWKAPAAQPVFTARRAFMGGAFAASALAVVGVVHPPWGLWPSFTELTSDFRTGVGEQREIQIGQAVAIQMNTQTCLNRRDTAQGAGIELVEGEVEIHVLDGATSHLHVQAGPGRMQAQQAQFNVRYTGRTVTVTCLQGQVMVQANQTVTLQAGQQTVYDYERIQAVQRPNLDQVSSWRRGYLAFEGQALSEVVEELNRYRPGKIVVYSDSLKSRPVYLSLSISDMDLALDMLRAMSGIRVQELAGGIALLRQA
ncbi:DUF4880 domain-containing protein [Providencia rettgeri]|nr:DUF4880 domain-containing protein [Providencia rettgeri]